MGIQYLNSYIKKNVGEQSLVKSSLRMLENRTIAVDISIYLYRYLAEGELIENIYNMLSIFYYYKIIPIFVFDGKPPIEKYNLIQKRNEEKSKARITYKKIQEELENTVSDKQKDTLIESMQILKKKFIKVENNDLNKVKNLITAFGFNFIEANCEADIICGKLVNKNIAWACMSEDMDMFLYGCSRVIRYFSMINHTVIVYNLKNILEELNLTFKEFKEICVISGTDYNISNNTNLYKTLEYFKEYKEYNKTNKNLDFFEWLDNNTNYVDNIYCLYNIFYMFKTDNIELRDYNINFKKQDINFDMIKEIMKPEGFIFT
tara:strand:+ start:2349 stop:3305 length:957 start_codon:yes stop_codon:yes gene_type:complete